MIANQVYLLVKIIKKYFTLLRLKMRKTLSKTLFLTVYKKPK